MPVQIHTATRTYMDACILRHLHEEDVHGLAG